MYVFVTQDTDTVLEKMLTIKHLKLTFNNTDVIDCDAKFVTTFACNWDMAEGVVIDHSDSSGRHNNLKYIMRIDLGHGNDSDLGNVVAFRELSNPTLTVEHTGADASKKCSVHVIYETASFLTASADTGRVQLSLSS